MARVQLALNVADLDAAIEFYSKMFATEPAKVKPGYANFAIADPPLKLVLFAGAGAPGTLNHLGVETETAAEVVAATERLDAAGLDTAVQNNTSCCYAVQDKVWIEDPDGNSWEVFVVKGDAEVMESKADLACRARGCCA